ncbi:1-acyl-sn-glycerol-3-phosphate acyltransferase [uncultured Maricaulis sp.]|uniref:1-acyl-sn-glycerol-3-phosphate acyltransferase n=1 Tax=uncultured Maricaulis sp. TaxID=174710 RepID=UPI0030D875CA|tara:strand:- start:48163 stop:49050 length:888 start_codon:yes stop_codon:yes gene_type:complete
MRIAREPEPGFGDRMETDDSFLPAAPKHVVDDLIEDRAPRLINTPLWPIIKSIGYPLLGYRRAVAMVDAIIARTGTDCLDWCSDYLGLDVGVTGLEHVPETGACVIVSNHPGGIADGVAVWDALKAKRPDTLFFANRDALKVCPGLEERIIPVEWRDDARSRTQSRDMLKRAIEAFKAEQCIVIFPSGRMSEWSWSKWQLVEKPWHPTAVSLARKFKAPIIPLAVRQRMPILYYALAQINEELKDMTIFHGFMGKADARYALAFGRAMQIGPDDGSDAEATAMMRDICERTAWGK